METSKIYDQTNITSTVPIPEGRGNYNGKYRFVHRMKVGDSFTWTIAKYARCWAAMRKIAQRTSHEMRFRSRVDKVGKDGLPKTYRIWRIK
jgi:hypothetical protein